MPHDRHRPIPVLLFSIESSASREKCTEYVLIAFEVSQIFLTSLVTTLVNKFIFDFIVLLDIVMVIPNLLTFNSFWFSAEPVMLNPLCVTVL